MVVAAVPGRADRGTILKAVNAGLRLTSRELARALSDSGLRKEGSAPEIAVLRGKARLNQAQLREVHGLYGRIEDVLRRAKTGTKRGKRFYAVMFVLVPSGPSQRSSSS
jgi:hypothetical protein